MHNFKKMDIWKDSTDYVTKMYQVTSSFPKTEIYGLASQIQRAAVSIPTNIAEGSAKSSDKDFARFLEMSIGSSFELETELIVAKNLSYITAENLFELQTELSKIQQKINKFKDQLK
jgi:four helix bundle protein